eukprot:2042293-Prymnesium_polylepis.1
MCEIAQLRLRDREAALEANTKELLAKVKTLDESQAQCHSLESHLHSAHAALAEARTATKEQEDR